MQLTLRWLLVMSVLLAAAMPARAVNYTWTNTVSDASGYWTNGVLWGQLVTTYPSGGVSSDEAYLTNQFVGTYTNILNSRLNFAVNRLAISNALGEAWLIITNNTAGTGVSMTNITVVLGSGSRLQIDDGATVRITSALSWLGTNGTIYLNNGSQLATVGNTIIGTGGGVTSLVTSASGGGNGGIWNASAASLTVGNSSTGQNNYFEISNGVILTNLASLVVGANLGADSNTVVVTNGSRLFMNAGTGGLFVGAASSTTRGGSGNTVILSNSVLRLGTGGAGFPITVGWGSSNNTLTLLADTLVDGNGSGINVGGNLNTGATYTERTYNNVMNINGAVLTNVGTVSVGFMSGGAASSLIGISNLLHVVNGGVLSNVTQLQVGGSAQLGAGSGYNSLIVTGGGGFFMTGSAGNIIVGSAGAGNNTVLISNSVLLATTTTIGSGSSNNTVTLLDTIWDHRGGALNLGSGASIGNVLRVNDGLLTNFGMITVGGAVLGSATGNQLILENGSVLSNFAGLKVGTHAGNNGNTVLITTNTAAFMSVNNSVNAVFIGGTASGAGSSSNTVILSNSVLRSGNTVAGGAPITVGWGSSNNTLTLLGNTVWDNQNQGVNVGGNVNASVGGGPSLQNVLTLDGALISNVGVLAIGYNAGGPGNPVTISNSVTAINGSVLSNVTLLGIGGRAPVVGADYNSLIVTGANGGGLFMTSAGVITVGAGGSFNTVILSNSVLSGNTAAIGGSGTVSNSLTLLANSLWNQNGTTLTLNGTGNVLRLHGSVLTNSGALTLNGNQNSVLVTDGGKLFGTGNILFNTANYGNTIRMDDGVWNLNGNVLSVGGASFSSNNTFHSSGGIVTGALGLVVGGLANSPTRSNDFNTVIFTNGGAFIMRAAGAVQIGSAGNQQPGGNNNTVILADSFLWSGGTSVIGSGSTNNSLTLLAGSVWNGQGNALYLGGWATFSGSSNSLFVRGGILTNFAQLSVGGQGDTAGKSSNLIVVSDGGVISNFAGLWVGRALGANLNSVIVTNDGRVFMTAGAITVGGGGGVAGGNDNTVILSNSVLKSSLPNYIGGGSTNNTLTLLDTVWDVGGQTLNVGGGIGSFSWGQSNVVNLQSSIVSNIGTLTIAGTGGSSYNQLLATDSVLSNVTHLYVGGSLNTTLAGQDYNSLIVTGNGAGLYMTSAGAIAVGAAGNQSPGGSYNTVILSNSVLWSSVAANIGNVSTGNTVTLLADTVWNGGGQFLSVGGYNGAVNGVGNVLTVNDAMLTNFGTVQIGRYTGSVSNQLVLANGSLLEANTLIVGSGAGNSISNHNSTYQFTAAPAITSVTPGDISLTDGTLSFRATGVANVATNYRIAFAGANTFMLNNASNSAATVSQTYQFNVVPGNPSNYVHLVMVNGATAYRNANGADITIGSAGTFLASNTVATISGNFTNNGFAEIVDATVNFQSALHVAGTLTLRNGFVTGSAAKTIAGTLRGNGSVVGDATITGDLSPGLSLGTLVFSNNLTLAGSYQAEFGDGGNDQLIVVVDLTLAGATLDLTAVGGLTGAAYVIASYEDLFGTFSVTNGVPVGYTVDYSYNGNQIAIVVVPEPGSLTLVALGLIALGIVYHYRRARL